MADRDRSGKLGSSPISFSLGRWGFAIRYALRWLEKRIGSGVEFSLPMLERYLGTLQFGAPTSTLVLDRWFRIGKQAPVDVHRRELSRRLILQMGNERPI